MMKVNEAIDVLRRGATRKHGVLWGVTGGGHGEPGGVPFVEKACSCLRPTLTGVNPPDESLPCDCGARAWNDKVEQALNSLLGAMREADELYWNSDDVRCICEDHGRAMPDCPRCEQHWKAHCLLTGTDPDEEVRGN